MFLMRLIDVGPWKWGFVVARALNEMSGFFMRDRITAAFETDRLLLHSGCNAGTGGFSVPVCSPEKDKCVCKGAKCMSVIGTEGHQVTLAWPQIGQCLFKSVPTQAQFCEIKSADSISEILYPILVLFPLLESFGEHFSFDMLYVLNLSNL